MSEAGNTLVSISALAISAAALYFDSKKAAKNDIFELDKAAKELEHRLTKIETVQEYVFCPEDAKQLKGIIERLNVLWGRYESSVRNVDNKKKEHSDDEGDDEGE